MHFTDLWIEPLGDSHTVMVFTGLGLHAHSQNKRPKG